MLCLRSDDLDPDRILGIQAPLLDDASAENAELEEALLHEAGAADVEAGLAFFLHVAHGRVASDRVAKLSLYPDPCLLAGCEVWHIGGQEGELGVVPLARDDVRDTHGRRNLGECRDHLTEDGQQKVARLERSSEHLGDRFVASVAEGYTIILRVREARADFLDEAGVVDEPELSLREHLVDRRQRRDGGDDGLPMDHTVGERGPIVTDGIFARSVVAEDCSGSMEQLRDVETCIEHVDHVHSRGQPGRGITELD